MTQAKLRFSSVEEYLAYDNGTETPFELVNGVLIEMPSESHLNVLIAMFLVSKLLGIGVPYYLVSTKTEIEVTSREVTVRYADLVVMTEALDAALSGKTRSIIRSDMPPPVLVVEVVSPGEPGTENYDRDYIDKRKEYAARKIPEYWLVDPSRNIVIVLELEAGKYVEVGQFSGVAQIVSPTFPALQLTADEILKGGR
jgi:Uma2 family endonuclease